MSRRRHPIAVVILVLAASLGPIHPLAAEETEPQEDEWEFTWSNGFKLELGDDFELKFGGRIQADYTFASVDDALELAFGPGEFQDGFEFRRARLFTEGTIYRRVKFKAQYDFAGGDADFKDVWLGLKLDVGELRFGHYKEYFSLEEQTSSKYLAFLERSLPVEAFSPSRNSGVGLHGNHGDTVNWGVGVFYDADDFGVSSDDKNRNVSARVGFRPLFEDKGKRLLHLGLAVNNRDRASDIRFRARPEAHFTTRLVDTGALAADSALIVGAEVAGVLDRFWFAGEYIQADVDTIGGGPDPTFAGAYVQAGYYLTADHRRFKTSSGAFDRQKPSSNWDGSGGKGAWEIAARFSTLDLSDGAAAIGLEQDNITLALNWYLNPATRLMINFVQADVGGVGDANFALVRWQVDF